MSTPNAQGADLQDQDLDERRSADGTYASEDDTPAPDGGHRQAADGEVAIAAALAEFNDAVQFAIDLAAPLDETDAAETIGEQPQHDEDDAAFSPPAMGQGRFAGDALLAMPRFLRLDAETAPEPAGQRPRRARYFLIRYASMVGCAAVVAYGLTALPIPQALTGLDLPERLTDGVGAIIAQVKTGTAPAARLFVKNQQALADEPLPIDISVENAVQDTSLRLDGLAVGTRLSAGSPVGVSSWQFPLHDLKSLYLYAPAGFVGVMHSGVDLFGPGKRLIDRRDVRFEWLAVKKSPPPPAAAPSNEPKPPVEHPRISAALAETLMQRGQGFLNTGDIGAARILFERLADAGVADGVLALAETYDPRYLASHNVIGLVGDEAKARALYRRAMQLGSAEAGRMFEQATRN